MAEEQPNVPVDDNAMEIDITEENDGNGSKSKKDNSFTTNETEAHEIKDDIQCVAEDEQSRALCLMKPTGASMKDEMSNDRENSSDSNVRVEYKTSEKIEPRPCGYNIVRRCVKRELRTGPDNVVVSVRETVLVDTITVAYGDANGVDEISTNNSNLTPQYLLTVLE